MAILNARIEDSVKDKVDSFLRERGVTPTQLVNMTYHYVAQTGKIPFNIQQKVSLAEDVVMAIYDRLIQAGYVLEKIKSLIADGHSWSEEVRLLSRLVNENQENGYQLEDPSFSTEAVSFALYPLARAHHHLVSCQFALTSAASDSVRAHEHIKTFVKRFDPFFTQLKELKNLLVEAEITPQTEPIREFTYRGKRVSVTVRQPEDYMHGAWKVRLELSPGAMSEQEEAAGFLFPTFRDRVFMAGSLYGKAVFNPQTGKHESGFRFHSGISKFHMYSGGPEEKNGVSLDELSSQLCACIEDLCLAKPGEVHP